MKKITCEHCEADIRKTGVDVMLDGCWNSYRYEITSTNEAVYDPEHDDIGNDPVKKYATCAGCGFRLNNDEIDEAIGI